ncbi:uncharacterized protein N0V89_007943 [Didymosphaeria variabile]|uniref:F-box domain-containing protein n=1 Tax=Didymosphaeria variabile TaxID=1932322 RepID=A0A9W8XEU4_9PLEO|nr:uncharacterized protein N0V89_007943 [Didymosphaeria variabile]KAJ4349329.1 hypothetical protein N0V89_007943 [Didymosphaeria variabile]
MTTFPFLELPAELISIELRNMIYEFAAFSEEPTRIVINKRRADGNYIGLARVCRQIRKEYLWHQVYRQKARIRVHWRDLDTWLSTFAESNAQPKQLQIAFSFDVHGATSGPKEIDILPLLHWNLTSSMSTCKIVFVNGHTTESVPIRYRKHVQSRNEDMVLQLQSFLDCNHAAWHADVKDDGSRLKKVLINLAERSITFTLRNNKQYKALSAIKYTGEVGLGLTRALWWTLRVKMQEDDKKWGNKGE